MRGEIKRGLRHVVQRAGAEYQDLLTALAERVRDLTRAPMPEPSSRLIALDQLPDPFAIAGPPARAAAAATTIGLRSTSRSVRPTNSTMPEGEARTRDINVIRALRTESYAVLLLLLRSNYLAAFASSALGADVEGWVARVDLVPIAGDALREVIVGPARSMDVRIEPALVERLVAEFDNQPGALPLLQLTLTALWHKRQGSMITMAHYDEIGRVALAGNNVVGDGSRNSLAVTISTYADTVLRNLTRTQERMALRILIRLVSFGEGTADTRRQQLREALRSVDDAAADFDAALHRLVEGRLVTVSGKLTDDDVRVDLAHEILSRAWSTFADWSRSWRGHEQRRRELEAAAAAWRERGCGDGGLFDPIELVAAATWREKAGQELGQAPN